MIDTVSEGPTAVNTSAAELAAALDAAQARRAELAAEREAAIGELEVARDERGRLLAEGRSKSAITKHIASLVEQIDASDRAIGRLDREIADLRVQLAAAELTEARDIATETHVATLAQVRETAEQLRAIAESVRPTVAAAQAAIEADVQREREADAAGGLPKRIHPRCVDDLARQARGDMQTLTAGQTFIDTVTAAESNVATVDKLAARRQAGADLLRDARGRVFAYDHRDLCVICGVFRGDAHQPYCRWAGMDDDAIDTELAAMSNRFQAITENAEQTEEAPA